MEYDNTNRGVLFRNDRKETEKQPDFTGSLDIDGVDHYLSAWIKTSKAGKKYFDIKFNPKQKVAQQHVQKAKQQFEPEEDFSDDIPF
jgi:uncharacterized protein (DUF736 family)